MKNNNVFVVAYYRYYLCLILGFISMAPLANDIELSDLSSAYTLGYGDMVSIKVYGEEDLSVDAELNNVESFHFHF